MTWVKFLNLTLFQWTGFRLARLIEESGEQSGWAVLGPVLPLTGWEWPYIGYPEPRLRWISRRFRDSRQ